MSEFLAPNVWPDAIWREPSRALAQASQQGRRRVATASPRIALARNELDGSEIAAGLEAIERGRFGDGPVRDAVKARVDAHDERYFDAEDEGDMTTSATEFARARAMTSLWYALSDDTDAAASGALYEASHAVDDASRAQLVEMVFRELQQ
jgi:predicted transcriptional regulator